VGQGLDPAALLKPPSDTWPTYNGDYSGRRYSPLTQINASNVGTLTRAWTWRLSEPRTAQPSLGSALKATPLEVNGALYFSEPDNVWAVDARTGEQIWHYQYPPTTACTSAAAVWGCMATGFTSKHPTTT
jgi:alcohol dehydrogenase (cytochrome c)